VGHKAMSSGHTEVGCSPRPGSTIATALRRLHHASAHVTATAAFFAAAEQQSPTGGDGDGKKVATTAAAGYSLVRLAAADLHECALLSSQAYRHFWDDGTLDGEVSLHHCITTAASPPILCASACTADG
jgi:hypothetical protein